MEYNYGHVCTKCGKHYIRTPWAFKHGQKPGHIVVKVEPKPKLDTLAVLDRIDAIENELGSFANSLKTIESQLVQGVYVVNGEGKQVHDIDIRPIRRPGQSNANKDQRPPGLGDIVKGIKDLFRTAEKGVQKGLSEILKSTEQLLIEELVEKMMNLEELEEKKTRLEQKRSSFNNSPKGKQELAGLEKEIEGIIGTMKEDNNILEQLKLKFVRLKTKQIEREQELLRVNEFEARDLQLADGQDIPEIPTEEVALIEEMIKSASILEELRDSKKFQDEIMHFNRLKEKAYQIKTQRQKETQEKLDRQVETEEQILAGEQVLLN